MVVQAPNSHQSNLRVGLPGSQIFDRPNSIGGDAEITRQNVDGNDLAIGGRDLCFDGFTIQLVAACSDLFGGERDGCLRHDRRHLGKAGFFATMLSNSTGDGVKQFQLLFAIQHAQVQGDTIGQRGDVVAPFEQAHDFAAAMFLRHAEHQFAERREVFGL